MLSKTKDWLYIAIAVMGFFGTAYGLGKAFEHRDSQIKINTERTKSNCESVKQIREAAIGTTHRLIRVEEKLEAIKQNQEEIKDAIKNGY